MLLGRLPPGWPPLRLLRVRCTSSSCEQSVARLDALLSRCGHCSRSEAKEWLKRGRVSVDGITQRSPSSKALPSAVLVDGEPLDHPKGLFVLLHKPAGVVCSHDAREGPTVFDLLPPRWLRRTPGLQCVGRLDRDTTGALLLTDCGALLHALTSPKKKVAKVYEAELDVQLPATAALSFVDSSIVLDGDPCAPATLVASPTHARAATVTLTEGRHHQVKRMFSAIGCQVTQLHRAAIGEWNLEGLQEGEVRVLELPADAAD